MRHTGAAVLAAEGRVLNAIRRSIPVGRPRRRMRSPFTRRIFRVAVSAMVVLALAPGMSLAQEYPSRPIGIIVPLAPGGAVDLLAKKLGDELEAALHVQVVIETSRGPPASSATASSPMRPPTGTRCCSRPRLRRSSLRTR